MKKKTKDQLKYPRLYVFKSNKHIYAQIIDDNKKQVLCSSSSISNNLNLAIRSKTNCGIAYIVGQDIGLKASNMNISRVVFDRGEQLYHGKIQAIADGAREKGINF